MFSPFVLSSTPFIPCRPTLRSLERQVPGCVVCNTTEKFRAELLYKKYARFASVFFEFFIIFPIFFGETGCCCFLNAETQHIGKNTKSGHREGALAPVAIPILCGGLPRRLRLLAMTGYWECRGDHRSSAGASKNGTNGRAIDKPLHWLKISASAGFVRHGSPRA